VYELPQAIDHSIENSEAPHLILAKALANALTVIAGHKNKFDAAVVLLPLKWEPAFNGPLGDDFALHDHLKVLAAIKGIPTQVLNEDRALHYFCRCSVMWRLSIALYCKAGGVPWKLADADPENSVHRPQLRTTFRPNGPALRYLL
jgi:hypothetical protein